MGCLVDSEGFLSLANSLIEGTETYDNLQAFKRKSNLPEGPVGIRYFNQFKKRHDAAVSCSVAKMNDVKRQQFGSYLNVSLMYDRIYTRMANEGLAQKLDNPLWMDQQGNITSCENAFGLAVDYQLLHHERVLHIDETGCITNRRDKKCIDEAGVGRSHATDAYTDIDFNVLPITNALGLPVLCVVIFKEDKNKLPVSWSTGVDMMTVGPNPEWEVECGVSLTDMPCGPTCFVGEKEVPCLVLESHDGGVTSELLVDVFKHLDELEIFPRTEGLPNPFVILDGHNSRLGLSFLQYVNHDAHKWTINIGVPSGAHLWLGGNTADLNWLFNVEMAKAKEDLIYNKREICQSQRIQPTDFIPLINRAWSLSFGNKSAGLNGLNVLSTRGWNPMNRALLTNKEILKTRYTTKPTAPYTLKTKQDHQASRDDILEKKRKVT